jgi:outer membrane protein TolC
MNIFVRAIVAIGIVGLVCKGPAWAEGPPAIDPMTGSPVIEVPMSLRDAIQMAIGNNPNVQLFRERIEQARAATLTQLGALLPNMGSTVTQNNQTFFLGTIGGSPVRTTPFNIFDARGNLTQNLFSLSLLQRWKASREGMKVAELESAATNQDAAAAAALAYTDLLRADASVKAREANVELYRHLMKQAGERRTGGLGTGLDTARAEVQLENERQRLSLAKNEAEVARLNLIHALGISFDVRPKPTDELRLLEDPLLTREQALNKAMEFRAEVKAQMQRVKLASLTLDSTVSERLPSLAARADVGMIGNYADESVNTHNVGLVLTVPIFDGGQREGRIKESRSQVKQEMIRTTVVKNKVTLEVFEALQTYASARDQAQIAKDGLRAALSEVELARERMITLAANNFELSNALFSLSRARDNMVDALFRMNAARINLSRATGEIDKMP